MSDTPTALYRECGHCNGTGRDPLTPQYSCHANCDEGYKPATLDQVRAYLATLSPAPDTPTAAERANTELIAGLELDAKAWERLPSNDPVMPPLYRAKAKRARDAAEQLVALEYLLVAQAKRHALAITAAADRATTVEQRRWTFIDRLLRLLAEYDYCDQVSWGEDLRFCVNCNDLFFWATADGEWITPENIDVLEQCFRDCKAASPVVGTVYAGELFACRVRNMRPQGAAYPKDELLWPLFDAAGPERETDRGAFGNPKPHP